jgi:hypothetical protein
MLIFKRLVKLILLISIAFFVYSYIHKGDLPQEKEIIDKMYQEPVQTETEIKQFQIQKKEFTYSITPKYNYELYGLVVSHYDSENWFDFWHKEDPFNTKDICVMWGDNIKTGVYQKMKFSHGEFTCYFNFKKGVDSSWYQKFSSAQGSNNHLLPKDDEVYKAIKQATTGDQIYLKGYLVDYSVKSPRGQSGTRATSTIRTDTGCEVVYTTDFQILKKGNTVYQLINQISKYLIIICISILTIFFFKF